MQRDIDGGGYGKRKGDRRKEEARGEEKDTGDTGREGVNEGYREGDGGMK